MTSRPRATGWVSLLPAYRHWSALLSAIVLLWILLVAGRGVVLALQALGVPATDATERSVVAPLMAWAAAVVSVSCLAAALLARRFRPASTLTLTLATGGVVLVIAAIATATLGSLLVALALFAIAWFVGHETLRLLPPTAGTPVVRVPLAVALGLGLGGVLLFALASLGQLSATTVVVSAAAFMLVLILGDRKRLPEDAQRLVRWRPGTPSWLETVVIGVTVGVVTFALLAVFVPENISDAILQHLPIARGIWQTGTLAAFPLMTVSQEPIAGHLLYAAAYGLGGMTTAKLVHAGVGLTAIGAVAGVAWLGAGRLAAVAGAAICAGMPLALWLLGHAFLDLFPVLFTVTTVLGILLWQRDGHPGWLVCAGILAGSGAAAKLPTMGIMIAAIVIALVVVGRQPGHWRERVFAVAIFGLSAAVVIVPWLLRSYALAGGLARLDPLLSRLGDAVPGTGGFMTDGPIEAMDSGVDTLTGTRAIIAAAPDHSPVGLLRLPWDLTFNTDRFGFPIIRPGEVGLAGLMLLPLLVFAPRTRMMAFLVVTAVGGLLGWWLTPLQVTRHALPALAILAAMAGIGFASAIATPARRPRRALATVARAGLIASGVAALIFVLPARLATLPVDLITGRQSADEYIARQLPVASVLASAADEIPAGSLVAYIGRHTKAPQIYTDVQLVVYENPIALGATPEEVLANLDRLGIDYIVWNRYRAPAWGREYWRSAILSTEFLRDHSRIVAGDDEAYVFALLPGNGKTWGVDQPRNLLTDPDLDAVADDGPWKTVGSVRARKGIVSMREQASLLAQEVPVTPGQPYLLSATATCDAADDRTNLSLRWLDSSGQELAAATEVVFPGDSGSEQFIWRQSPPQAATVSAEVASTGCKFDKLALYELT